MRDGLSKLFLNVSFAAGLSTLGGCASLSQGMDEVSQGLDELNSSVRGVAVLMCQTGQNVKGQDCRTILHEDKTDQRSRAMRDSMPYR